jgi:hypothetical protein
MYLRAEKYVSDYSHEEGKNTQQVNSILESAGFDRSDLSEDSPSVRVSFNVLYWRKANAIHSWFVNALNDGEDNCQQYYVNRKDLEELASLCAEVIKDPNNAEDYLSTEAGFFFGSQEYDEYYFEEIDRTRKSLMAILANPNFDNSDFYYQASW